MIEEQWIGIQFNLSKEMDLKNWLKNYELQGIESDGEHISIEFNEEELNSIESINSDKLQLMIEAIKKYLEYSKYTNIYYYLNVDDLSNQKIALLNGEFKNPVRISDFEKRNSIFENWNLILESKEVKELLAKNTLIGILNEVFKYVVNRDFEISQGLTLELDYQDREEWDADNDNLEVSIQLTKM